MGFEEIDVKELLPQRAPFVMIEALMHFDAVITRTRLQVMDDNIFVENDKLSEAGVMENIAQTCAARMGYINKYVETEISGGKIKLGFIGAIKNLVIEELPKVGDELITTVEVMSEVFTLTLVNAKVEVNEKIIASCEMKISLTDIDS